MALSPSALKLLHKQSSNHRQDAKKSTHMGCFYCLKKFTYHDVCEWIDGGLTALCPYCGIDSVLDSHALRATISTNSEIMKMSCKELEDHDAEILKEMRDHWFSTTGKKGNIMKGGKEGRTEKSEIIEEGSDLTLAELQYLAHEMAVEKGFWDEDDEFKGSSIGTKIALIHSEISEALEEFRNPDREFDTTYIIDGKPEGLGVELADAVIRIADLAQHLQVDLGALIRLKMRYNTTRGNRHGGKRA